MRRKFRQIIDRARPDGDRDRVCRIQDGFQLRYVTKFGILILIAVNKRFGRWMRSQPKRIHYTMARQLPGNLIAYKQCRPRAKLLTEHGGALIKDARTDFK